MRPPEEVQRDLVGQWLAKATEDLDLVRHQVEFPKTHDLGQLLDLVAAVDPALGLGSLREITSLNPYGVAARYPGDLPETTPEKVGHAVSLAERVGQAIRSSLRDYIGGG